MNKNTVIRVTYKGCCVSDKFISENAELFSNYPPREVAIGRLNEFRLSLPVDSFSVLEISENGFIQHENGAEFEASHKHSPFNQK